MTSTSSLHHASLLVGGSKEALSYLDSLCATLGVEQRNNPDIISIEMESLGIDEARRLSTLSAHKSVGVAKVFFISARKMTREAQNALLKTFEDPSENTYFLVHVKNAGLIISTLRSRMQLVNLVRERETDKTLAENFLSLSPPKRLLFAKKFVDQEGNLADFLELVLALLRERKRERALREVYQMLKFSEDAVVSPRLVLEHLALVL